MNGRGLLLDTNVVIYLAKKELNLLDFAIDNDLVYISSITYMECLGYKFPSTREEKIITDLVRTFIHTPLSREIENYTIEIRKSYKIKLPDAIIAATAIVNNLYLITNNVKDFDMIQNLKIINPFFNN